MRRLLLLGILMAAVLACSSGDGLVDLTRDSHIEDRWPSWSPDGSKLVFTSLTLNDAEMPEATDFGIYVMDADGKNRTQMLRISIVRSASWSPDGEAIIFAGSAGYIYTMDLAGSQPEAIVAGGSRNEIADWPSYSPDGSKILYAASVVTEMTATLSRAYWQIFIVDSDGNNVARLSPDGVDDYYPMFSPDGTRIAFSSTRDGKTEIYVMDRMAAIPPG